MSHVVTIHDTVNFTIRHPHSEGLTPGCGLEKWLASHINSPWEAGIYEATRVKDRWRLTSAQRGARLHVIGLPHTQVTEAWDHCAFTGKIRKFVNMMHDRGHHVTLYSAGETDARCSEHVTCWGSEEQAAMFSEHDWWAQGNLQAVDWDANMPYWRSFNERVINNLRPRLGLTDTICFMTGDSQAVIMDTFASHRCIEYGVGYQGIRAKYCAFESYAWMHAVYTWLAGGSAANADGRFYDDVIPAYFEVDRFPQGQQDGGYLLFMSRMIERKGYQLAIRLAERTGMPLKVAGTMGDRPQHPLVEYVGYADPALRAELMGGAHALLMPTLYLEPFGAVVVEAMLTGTPVISTDWGAMTETVRQGIDGYRCRTMAEFETAVEDVVDLDPDAIRRGAIERYSTETVGNLYDRWLGRLGSLRGDGFYAPSLVG